ncbi:MAG: monovalent cation/H+ antiporter subunit D family protein, partial [Candidatus Aminicenantes bacterium]
MILYKQAPALIVAIPLLSAFAVNICGWFNKRACFPMALLAMAATFGATLIALFQVMDTGPISYRLGGWPPPIGIEYVIDHLNGLVLV